VSPLDAVLSARAVELERLAERRAQAVAQAERQLAAATVERQRAAEEAERLRLSRRALDARRDEMCAAVESHRVGEGR
jgi:hypothetical protein